MKKHVNILVKGKVQCVFYRAGTELKARMLGISGYVCNEINGDVYIEAEGEAERLNRLVEWCKKGPPGAIIKSVSVEETDLKQYKSFVIKR